MHDVSTRGPGSWAGRAVLPAAPFPPLHRLVDTAAVDTALAQVADRLQSEFGGSLPRPVIADVVADSRHDLRGSPPAALPELVERLARQRLLDRATGLADPHLSMIG